MDLVWVVIDRVNGSFVGLDAGVFCQLVRVSVEQNVPDGEGCEIFFGFDDWGDVLEIVCAVGFGGSLDE